MITYRNNTQGQLVLEDENGKKHSVIFGGTITGSAYWKQFAQGDHPMLSVIEDDGSEYINGEQFKDAGRIPYAQDMVVGAESDYEDNVIDFSQEIGGPAIVAQIHNTGSVTIKMKLNGTAVVNLTADEERIFDLKELVIATLAFKNESESESTVRVFAVGK